MNHLHYGYRGENSPGLLQKKCVTSGKTSGCCGYWSSLASSFWGASVHELWYLHRRGPHVGGIGVSAIPQHNLRSEVTRALPDLAGNVLTLPK